MSTEKLTPHQVEVIWLMAEGWEMGLYAGHAGAWLHNRGPGKGGGNRHINLNTFNALSLKGLIAETRHGYPESLWGLTALGHQEAELRKGEL